MFAVVPNAPANKHAVVVNWPETGLAGFAKVDRWAGASSARAYCPLEPNTDPVCSAAVAAGLCQPSGSKMQRCTLSPAERSNILHK